MMDPRPAQTVLASQGYSPPAPGPATVPPPPPSAILQTQNAEEEYDSSSNYGGAKSNHTLHRQPLQESSGNAQYHQHQSQHHNAHISHYLPGQYPLPSLPSTRSCTPLHSHHAQYQHQFGGPLIPPPPAAPTPPAAATILQSNNDIATTVAIYQPQQQQQQHHRRHANAGRAHHRVIGRVPSPLRLQLQQPLTDHQLGVINVDQKHPFFSSHDFVQYRAKQKDKDCKEAQKWPDDVEVYFLDGEFSSCLETWCCMCSCSRRQAEGSSGTDA